ncbi:glycoside hydrolase family 9 protein [Colwelliaceae bacterium 6441]
MSLANKIMVMLVLSVTVFACSSNKSLVKKNSIAIHLNQVALELSGKKSALISIDQPVNLSKLKVDVIKVSEPDNVVFSSLVSFQGVFNEWQTANNHPYYYLADFSELKQSGQYQLHVTYQNQSVKSASFTIAENAIFNTTVSALLDYFKYSRNDQRYSWEEDKHIRVFDEQRFVDVRGGWNDAGGDTGKYLSHLSYSNFLNPQQLSLVAWALAYSYQEIPQQYKALSLDSAIIEEVFWGADYLHRILDPQGYFYMTIFDQWNTNNAERVVTSYEGPEGIYTNNYQAAFRQGAGTAIAALARASMLAEHTQKQGEYSGQQYLADAEKAFAHLLVNNARYCDDGQENIIDDYTALIAAIELFRATDKQEYLTHARQRAKNLSARTTSQGWLISNHIDSENKRPFYHAAEAGFPVFALSHYIAIENDKSLSEQARAAIAKNLAYQLQVNSKATNPFNYARQPFKTYQNGVLELSFQEGFFIPHANETEYWWQGESARLSSLSAASLIGGRLIVTDTKTILGINPELANFAQNQLDWTLGRNPYNVSMLNGFGVKNPLPYDGLDMVKGGISNGITGAKNNDAGRGIEFAPEPDWQNWRWVEQWLPHSTWFLIANTELVKAVK